MKKELIEKAYEMGKESFVKYNNSPASNLEFMKIVPSCKFGDDEG